MCAAFKAELEANHDPAVQSGRSMPTSNSPDRKLMTAGVLQAACWSAFTHMQTGQQNWTMATALHTNVENMTIKKNTDCWASRYTQIFQHGGGLWQRIQRCLGATNMTA